ALGKIVFFFIWAVSEKFGHFGYFCAVQLNGRTDGYGWMTCRPADVQIHISVHSKRVFGNVGMDLCTSDSALELRQECRPSVDDERSPPDGKGGWQRSGRVRGNQPPAFDLRFRCEEKSAWN
ncbi:hypothetical protein M5D96_013878, partial [Drosophila gunungcola]